MQKWEYIYLDCWKEEVKKINKKEYSGGSSSLPVVMNKLGDEGWELVGNLAMDMVANSLRLTFKRPKD